MTPKDSLSIIIGVGQVVDHWEDARAEDAPIPLSLITKAVDKAFQDSGMSTLREQIDTVAVVRSFSDSLRQPFDLFGAYKSLPAALVQSARLDTDRLIYSSVGGEQPQALVSELSASIAQGKAGVVLIAGREANAALRLAFKNKLVLDWSSEIDTQVEDRGAKTDFVTKYEIDNGMGLPPQTYAALEQALRARLGLSKSEYLTYMSGVCAKLSDVAADHPYAQFPKSRDVDYLSTASRTNYPVCDPYLKWHVAQDAVNQAAALILTSVGRAKELGIDSEKWVYLHGSSQVEDVCVSQRSDLSKSLALELALTDALQAANVSTNQIAHRDIYSCFPIVVHLAAEVLGLDPTKDQSATMRALAQFETPVGQTVKIRHHLGKNYLVNPNLLGHPMSEHFLARDFKYVTLVRNGHCLEVTLNRPDSYNALHSAAHFELAEIFDAFEADQGLWVVIITGTGEKAFCSGNDLKVTAQGGDMSMPSTGFAGLCSRTDREKPVIAAVNGVAMGGGLEIVLACDIAVASPTATFALPEVKVGLFAAAGGVQRLTRQIGEKAAMELILTGRKIGAEEAQRLGLINSIAPSGDALTAARDLAETIIGNSPTSIRASKRELNAVDQMGDWSGALALSQSEIRNLLKTKDAREGVTAFAQKRKPNWVNA